jgi:hypothetical protein
MLWVVPMRFTSRTWSGGFCGNIAVSVDIIPVGADMLVLIPALAAKKLILEHHSKIRFCSAMY